MIDITPGKEVWQVEMYKNIGTIEEPKMEWVTEKRIYNGKKDKSDFDLHDVEGKRKNAMKLNTGNDLKTKTIV